MAAPPSSPPGLLAVALHRRMCPCTPLAIIDFYARVVRRDLLRSCSARKLGAALRPCLGTHDLQMRRHAGVFNG
eukprot:4149343-Pleurochrysis_carterae.AAC.1